MSRQGPSLSERAYRFLLRALPFDFRADFGDEMEEVFRDQQRHASSRGLPALLRLWGETVAGIFQTAPREHISILKQDASYGLRRMRREPGRCALIIGILALGIGPNTALFSVINATILKPLPFREDAELVTLTQWHGDGNMQFSVPELTNIRERNRTLIEVAEYHTMPFNLITKDSTERVRTGVVSANYFDLLGIRPVLGRPFQASDEVEGAPAVMLLSHDFWLKRGGNAELVGQVMEMNDRPITVIGVLPPLPQHPEETDVFMTTVSCPFRIAPAFVRRVAGRMMTLFGRLKPGVTAEQARADIDGIAGQFARQHPDAYRDEGGYKVAVAPLKNAMTDRARPLLWLLMGAAGFVLLTAIANVTNLMLSGIARREPEMTMRAAFGAPAARIFRQFVTENLILATLAAGAGVGLAILSLRWLVEFAGRLTPRASEIAIDQTALAFAVGAGVISSIVLGSITALNAPRHFAGRMTPVGQSARRLRLQGVFVICQVAFSFILLAGAGLLGRSFLQLLSVDPGFEPQHVVTARLYVNWNIDASVEELRKKGEKFIATLGSKSGVLSAALCSALPLDADGMLVRTTRVPFQTPKVVLGEIGIHAVSSRYFETMGVPLLAGRAFSESANAGLIPEVIVSEGVAKRLGGAQQAVGQLISSDKGASWRSIAGVAKDVRESTLGEPAIQEVYEPLSNAPAHTHAVAMRSTLSATQAAEVLRTTIREFDPEVAVDTVRTMEDAFVSSLGLNRLATTLVGLFAIIALMISITGIYGILALTVTWKARDTAIRMALGIGPARLVAALLAENTRRVLIGIVGGWMGASLVTTVLNELLFRVTPTDSFTFLAVAAVLLFGILFACLPPAIRAARVDVAASLRID